MCEATHAGTGFTPKDAKYYGSEHAENQAGALSLMPVNLASALAKAPNALPPRREDSTLEIRQP